MSTADLWERVRITRRGEILVLCAVFLLLLDIVRLFVFPQSYQVAFTDAFEAVVVLLGALASGFAAARSEKLSRALWAMTAASFALGAASDFHDFLVDLHLGGATLLHPLEFLGWSHYPLLALVIFFPTLEEGQLRWKWLPVIDFAQVGIAVGLVYFRFIYLHHVDLGQGWTAFGHPELVRNILISAGLLLRGVFEPAVRPRAVYRTLGAAFATITLLKGVVPAYAVIGRPAALLAIGIFAACWRDRSDNTVVPEQKSARLRLALSMSAGAALGVVLWLAYDAPAHYRWEIQLPAAFSALLFLLRGSVADHTRYTALDELRKSEREYRLLFESAIVPIMILDPDTEAVLQANPAACELYELDWDHLVGSDFKDFTKDVARGQRQIAELMRTGVYPRFESVHRTRTGREIDVLVTSSMIQYRGRPAILSFNRDVTQVRRAEKALEASEDRYRDLVEHSEDLVCTHDFVGNLLSVNPAPARLLGYEVPELLKIPMRELIAPEFREQFDAYLARIKANGADKGLLCVVTRSGERRIWEYNNTLRTEGVATPIVRGMAHDVTERKRAETALRRSEQRYRLLFEKNIAGVGIASPDGRVLDCNDGWAHILGYSSADEVRGQPTSKFYFNLADREPILDALRRGKTFQSGEMQLRRQDGTPVWVLFDSSVLSEGGGTPMVQATMIDISERKLAEEALRESEQRFRSIYENSTIGIYRTTPDGRILLANPALAKMLGFSSFSDLSARNLEEEGFQPGYDRVEFQRRLADEGEIRGLEASWTKRDGTAIFVRESAKAIRDSEGEIAYYEGTVEDITDRKRAEESLRSSEERFRVALKGSPIAVFSQDRDLRYTWIYNFASLSSNEVLGKTDEEIMESQAARSLKELKQRVLNSGAGVREEIAITHNGRTFAYDITIEPLFDSDGKVVGITGAAMDIARLRDLADTLKTDKDQLVREKQYLESEIQAELGFEEVIGQSSALKEILQKARVVAPTDSTVLLLGETGTGKELVARAIHSLSQRCEGNFIKLNCAAVPSGLLESELFGHEKGAFTGAVNQKVGRIELADKGTLFLDEIGELPLELQPKLLRVLQDREFERLGGVHTLHVDVRIIAATNRDLQQQVAKKEFREDLFYRLNVFPIQLPPLRQRRGDIPMLVHHFVHKHAVRMGKNIERIPDETMGLLQNASWPGNIRELENMIERMVILTKGGVLAAPPVELEGPQDFLYDNLTEMEREHIIRVLRETHGVLSGVDGAASRLGIKRTTLQSMLKRLGIDPQEFRPGTGTFGKE